MTALIANFSPVLTWVIASLTAVVNFAIGEPLLMLFVALGVVGMILGWGRSFVHR